MAHIVSNIIIVLMTHQKTKQLNKHNHDES